MARKNEKTPTLKTLGDDELGTVSGGAKSQPSRSPAQQMASVKMVTCASNFEGGSAWAIFFASAATA